MKNLFQSNSFVRKIRGWIHSFENIFSNYWILVYPMQAIPAILFQLLYKWVGKKSAVVKVMNTEPLRKYPMN